MWCRRNNGPVAATVTIGGVAAPRHARTVAEILAHAQESLDSAKAKRRGSFIAYRPNIEREAVRKENVRATDKIVAALNERRILLAFEPLVRTKTRELAFYECLMRIRRADGSVVPATAVIPIAEQLGLVRLIDHRVIELVIAELSAAPVPQGECERIAQLDHRSGLVGRTGRAVARAARRRAAHDSGNHRDRRDPEYR